MPRGRASPATPRLHRRPALSAAKQHLPSSWSRRRHCRGRPLNSRLVGRRPPPCCHQHRSHLHQCSERGGGGGGGRLCRPDHLCRPLLCRPPVGRHRPPHGRRHRSRSRLCPRRLRPCRRRPGRRHLLPGSRLCRRLLRPCRRRLACLSSTACCGGRTGSCGALAAACRTTATLDTWVRWLTGLAKCGAGRTGLASAARLCPIASQPRTATPSLLLRWLQPTSERFQARANTLPSSMCATTALEATALQVRGHACMRGWKQRCQPALSVGCPPLQHSMRHVQRCSPQLPCPCRPTAADDTKAIQAAIKAASAAAARLPKVGRAGVWTRRGQRATAAAGASGGCCC